MTTTKRKKWYGSSKHVTMLLFWTMLLCIALVHAQSQIGATLLSIDNVRKIELNKTTAAALVKLLGKTSQVTRTNKTEIWTYRNDSTELIVSIDKATNTISRFIFSLQVKERERNIDYSLAKNAVTGLLSLDELEYVLNKPGRIMIEDGVESWTFSGSSSSLFIVIDEGKIKHADFETRTNPDNKETAKTITLKEGIILLDEIEKQFGPPQEIKLRDNTQTWMYATDNSKLYISAEARPGGKISYFNYTAKSR